MLGQDRIFHRPEQGRMAPHQEHHGQRQRHRSDAQRQPAQRHERNFRHFHHAGNRGLVTHIRRRPGNAGKQQIGQGEQTRRQRRQKRRLRRITGRHVIGHDEQKGGSKQIVVERAQQLRDEKRAKTPRGQQAEHLPITCPSKLPSSRLAVGAAMEYGDDLEDAHA